MSPARSALALFAICWGCQVAGAAVAQAPPRAPAAASVPLPIDVFYAVLSGDERQALAALELIDRDAQESSAALLIEMLHHVGSRRVGLRLVALIEKVSGRAFDGRLDAWYDWLWSAPRAVHPDYAAFKATLYEDVDACFREYFDGRPRSTIRLDEIRWGGVQHELGTSGFLYRSNKLMYDQATKSLGSTLTGQPVVGALVGQGIELQPLFVVTTTWKAWRERPGSRSGGPLTSRSKVTLTPSKSGAGGAVAPAPPAAA